MRNPSAHAVLPLAFVIGSVMTALPAMAGHITLSGTLATSDLAADGLITGNGNWATGTSLSWTVTHLGPLSSPTWHYHYQFSHNRGETSHLIIEVSSSLLDAAEFQNAIGDFSGVVVGDFGAQGNSNPGIPGTIHSVKFDGASGLTTTIDFDIDRPPVWGDFYAKNGKVAGTDNFAFNAGFTSPDTDPANPPANGSVLDHLLVPDTGDPPALPEPASIVLMSFGAVGLIGTIWRRRGRSSGL